MAKKQQIERINEIVTDEKVFRDKVLKILFMKMGYKGVTILHGANEHGKDIVFFEVDEKTGREINHAVVAKVGRLGGGTKNDKDNIINTRNQVKLAFDTSYDCTTRKRAIKPNQVWVITSGTISTQAQKQIVDLFGDNRQLYDRWVLFKKDSDLIEMLEKWWPTFFTDEDPFIVEYCDRLEKLCSDMTELRTLGYTRQMKSVPAVFTEPTLVEENKDLQRHPKKFSRKIQTKKYDIEALSSSKDNYWLIGSPGSGKSTIIKKLVLRLIEDVNSGRSNQVPVIVYFKELVEKNKLQDIRKYIFEKLQSSNQYEYEIDFDLWLKEGRISVFFDGLDEIPKKSLRDEAIQALKQFQDENANVRVIGACRDWDTDLFEERLNHFTFLRILPFNFRQIKRFVENWFLRKHKLQENMLEALKNTFMSGALPKTPMVLTLIAILFEERTYKEIPANLTELYTMFTELYLGKWDASRNIETMFEYNIKDNVLMHIAYEMHSKLLEKMPEPLFIDFIKEYIDQRKVTIDPPEILTEIEQRSRLIYKNDKGDYSFRHLSFQEYFVAKKLVQLGESKANLIQRALDPWWENVVFFYTGSKLDAPELLDNIIKNAEEITPYDAFHKRIVVGRLLQAAYLTEHTAKVDALFYIIDGFTHNFRESFDEMMKSAGKKRSEFFTVMLMKMILGHNLSSMTLYNAFKDVFKKYQGKTDYENKLKAYLIAYILASLEETSVLEEIASEPTDLDPILLGNLNMDLKWFSNEYGSEFDKKIVSKIKKKVKKNVAAIRKDLYLNG